MFYKLVVGYAIYPMSKFVVFCFIFQETLFLESVFLKYVLTEP